MRRLTIGKLLVSGVAAFTAVGGFLVDYNETHLFNPTWPPHAKFHDAQTISLGALLGGLSLWALWGAALDERARLRAAVALAALYWIAQATSLLFPKVALVDPEFEAKVPRLFGRPAGQPVLDACLLSLLATAYVLETRRTGAPERRRRSREFVRMLRAAGRAPAFDACAPARGPRPHQIQPRQ